MAISTYAELKSAVATFLDVDASDLTDAIDNLVSVAEARIYREAKTRDMETALTGTITSGAVALPSGYISLKLAYLTTSPYSPLERRSADWIYGSYPSRSAEGIPKYIAREGSNFIFGPYPDSGYSIGGIYYKNLGAVSSSAHALFTNNPDLYLYCALARSEAIFGRDDRTKLWEAEYQRILNDVNGLHSMEDVSGGSIRMRTR